MNRLRRTLEVNGTLLGCWTGGEHVRNVYPAEPPLCGHGWAGPRSVSGVSWSAKQGGSMAARSLSYSCCAYHVNSPGNFLRELCPCEAGIGIKSVAQI